VGESYYELLGVSPDASPEHIERAYRERLKETHPDVSDDEDASERTKRLIEAKEVLTDEDERARYDRHGHENYIAAEQSPDPTAGQSTGTSTSTAGDRRQSGTGTTRDQSGTTRRPGADDAADPTGAGTAQGRSTNGGGHATGQSRQRSREQRRGRGRHVRDKSWYESGYTWSDSEDAEADGSDSWRVWNTDGSFAVRRDGDSYQHGRMFASEQSLTLLLSTFAVYPVLLFGALLPEFPLLINLTLATCVILVIAFLQSIPEIGIAVFGIWSVLLPFGMLASGFDLLSIRGFLGVTAVVFPLGLSVLTRIAIRPITAG
jgi:molecular chaperone DnaJ